MLNKVVNLKLRPNVIDLWLLRMKYSKKTITEEEYLLNLESFLERYYKKNEALELMVSVIKNKYFNGDKNIVLSNMRDLAILVGVRGLKVLYHDSEEEVSVCNFGAREKNIYIQKKDGNLERAAVHELGHAIHFGFKFAEVPRDLENMIKQIQNIDIEKIDKFLCNLRKKDILTIF